MKLESSCNWGGVHEAYPVNRELIWLNNCGVTPPGRHVVEAVNGFMTDNARKGILSERADYKAVRKRIKTSLADLLNCKAEELALIHNTAEGMNFISHGVSLSEGDEIILLENEYPSNVYPWLHWKSKGVRIRTAGMEKTPEAFYEGFSRCITEKTRVVSLSAVHWCTGMPLPLEQIGVLCRERNIRFVLDGAQGVGMQPLDVKKANVSYMAFSAWKWLMGPLGLGVLYVPEEGIESLKPIFMGTESVVRDEEYLPYKSEWKPAADRFTFSTPSIGDWVYFDAALRFLVDLGFDAVRERLFSLTNVLNDHLRALGFRVYSDHFPGHPTGITVCEKPGISVSQLMGRLKNQGVIAAERLGRIRFSPHVFISPEQLEGVARVLSGV